jgi:uncharacterized protein (DUF433 family)
MRAPPKNPQHDERIVQDPAVLAGKPVVRGTRIPVGLVLEYLANNPSFDDLFADYPRLTMDDVRACFGFAHTLVDRERNAKPRARRLPSSAARS